MPVLHASDQPSNPPLWGLITAMIAASPDRPWVWAALLTAGVVFTGWRRA
ncbi:hypothetical protein [Streptomyces achromogenes]